MVVLKGLKRLIYQADMFCSSQLLRYNSQTQYKTLTGGLLSLAIICVIVVGFASMISDTLKRVSITSTLITQKQSNPPLLTLVPNKQNMFMLGLSIQSLDLTYLANLTAGPQYFSFKMITIQITSGVAVYTPNSIQLEQCRRDHWSMMPEFQAAFDSFVVSSWLCLPLDSPILLQGSYTSPKNFEVLIDVTACQNQTSNNTCAPQEDIEALFSYYQNFYLTLNYINPVINPNQQDYISHYIQGNDYVIFSSLIGSEAWIYFSDYTIRTDDSIWPYSHDSIKTGYIVQQKAINHPYSARGNSSLASVYLAKSVNSLAYTRQVQKISAVFSYIGGLVGAITAVLFLIKSYTDISLQVSIGINLFKVQKQEESDEDGKKFDFVSFLRLTIYRLLKFIGWKSTSEESQRLYRFQCEALKQMDIQLLLRRLIKLQTCMSLLFTPQRLQKIREGTPITLDSAKKMRLLLLKDEETSQEKTIKINMLNLPKEQIMNDAVFDQKNQEDIASKSQQSATSMRKHFNIKKDRYAKDITKDEQPPSIDNCQQSPFTLSSIINKKILSKLGEKGVNKIFPENPRTLPPIQSRQLKNYTNIGNG